jgi:hypothetical protein
MECAYENDQVKLFSSWNEDPGKGNHRYEVIHLMWHYIIVDAFANNKLVDLNLYSWYLFTFVNKWKFSPQNWHCWTHRTKTASCTASSPERESPPWRASSMIWRSPTTCSLRPAMISRATVLATMATSVTSPQRKSVSLIIRMLLVHLRFWYAQLYYRKLEKCFSHTRRNYFNNQSMYYL